MLRKAVSTLVGPGALAGAWRGLAGLGTSRGMAAVAQDTYNVPEGHRNSRLDGVTCNISLGRRRDLTLRQDIQVHGAAGPTSLAALLKDRKTLLLGLPGGKVCEEQHFPDYQKSFPSLKSLGIDKVIVVLQETPEGARAWAQRVGADPATTEVVADSRGTFTRMLGVEIAEGPAKNHRYTAIVDGGVLLRMVVEESPKDFRKCTAEAVAADIRTLMGGR